jgi:hypothetical protein
MLYSLRLELVSGKIINEFPWSMLGMQRGTCLYAFCPKVAKAYSLYGFRHLKNMCLYAGAENGGNAQYLVPQLGYHLN